MTPVKNRKIMIKPQYNNSIPPTWGDLANWKDLPEDYFSFSQDSEESTIYHRALERRKNVEKYEAEMQGLGRLQLKGTI